MTQANRGTKGGYWTGAMQKKEYTRLVALLAKSQRLKPIDYQADFNFLWICRNKRRDKDNIIAGQKFIFDGLQNAGIIKNDGWGEIGKIHHNFTIKNKKMAEGVIVTIVKSKNEKQDDPMDG